MAYGQAFASLSQAYGPFAFLTTTTAHFARSINLKPTYLTFSYIARFTRSIASLCSLTSFTYIRSTLINSHRSFYSLH